MDGVLFLGMRRVCSRLGTTWAGVTACREQTYNLLCTLVVKRTRALRKVLCKIGERLLITSEVLGNK